MKPIIIFYFAVSILFFISEPITYIVNKWAQMYYLGAEIVVGHIIPVIFLCFCCIGISSFIYGVLKVKKYKWKSFVPSFIITLSVLIYTVIPHSDYNVWYKVIDFYFIK